MLFGPSGVGRLFMCAVCMQMSHRLCIFDHNLRERFQYRVNKATVVNCIRKLSVDACIDVSKVAQENH